MHHRRQYREEDPEPEPDPILRTQSLKPRSTTRSTPRSPATSRPTTRRTLAKRSRTTAPIETRRTRENKRPLNHAGETRASDESDVSSSSGNERQSEGEKGTIKGGAGLKSRNEGNGNGEPRNREGKSGDEGLKERGNFSPINLARDLCPAPPPPTIPPESLTQRLRHLAQWQARYVLALREYGGIVALACRKVSVSRDSVSRALRESPEFAAACAEAVEDSTDLIEAAAFRGATVGDTQPIYQGGQLVGYRRVRSVKDAEIMLKIRGRLRDEMEVTNIQAGSVEVVHKHEAKALVSDVMNRLFAAGPAAAIDV